MDTNSLFDQSRARFNHEVAKRTIKEKYLAKMIFTYEGGMWQAGPELLTVLSACPVEDSIVILDLYGTPVRVDPNELHFLAFQRWQEQMNAWLAEYQEIQKHR